MHDLAGRIAIVTGAGSGIGAATARALARAGAKVHAADIDGDAAARVVREIEQAGGRAAAHTTDVTDPGAVETLAQAAYDADGAVHVLHNNAGVAHGGPVAETSLEEWRRIIEINLMGVVHGVHVFVPRMLAQGGRAHIVNTASMAGLVPVAEMVPYCTSKHAVVGLSESLNAELAPQGIRVSAICPGIINTPIVGRANMTGEMAPHQDEVVRFYERWGSKPEVVADAVLDAIRNDKLIRTVPRHHVALGWGLRRLSPRLAQPLAQRTTRMLLRGRR